MALTIKEIEAAKPREKPYRHSDANVLLLEVRPNGSKLWMDALVPDFREEKKISFSPYAEVSIKEARERRDETRRLLRGCADPSANLQN